MSERYTLRKKLAFSIGFSPRILGRSLAGIPYYLWSLRKYQRLNRVPSLRIQLKSIFPILTDRKESAGVAGGHYFYQDLWAAKKIYARRPSQHMDVGSRIDGFIAHLLVFMPVTIIDIRPLQSNVANLSFIRDDATSLVLLPSDSVSSLSTLHAAEHFGLGRYGDRIEPSACFQFMKSLQRVLAPGGLLYFSVPVGQERVEFNAHRVFAPRSIIENFGDLRLLSFSYVDDDGTFHENDDPDAAAQQNYGCGLFEFVKGT